jgi:GntR family transcriptional regulator
VFFNIDPSNGLAIYDQIVRQIKFAVANDSLQTGELVPSVRELSRELAVNPNTVSRAYRELQSQEIVAPVRGTGLQVTEQAPKHCRQERVRLIRERLRSVLLEAKQSGLEADEIRTLVEREFSKVDTQRKTP